MMSRRLVLLPRVGERGWNDTLGAEGFGRLDWWDLNEDGRMAAAAGKSCRERFDSLHDPEAAWRESRVEESKLSSS